MRPVARFTTHLESSSQTQRDDKRLSFEKCNLQTLLQISARRMEFRITAHHCNACVKTTGQLLWNAGTHGAFGIWHWHICLLEHPGTTSGTA